VLIFRDSSARPKLSKVNVVDVIFCCLALFVQPGLQLISERDDEYIFFSQHSRKPYVVCSIFLIVLEIIFSPFEIFQIEAALDVLHFLLADTKHCSKPLSMYFYLPSPKNNLLFQVYVQRHHLG
jgi:hypothetical protein